MRKKNKQQQELSLFEEKNSAGELADKEASPSNSKLTKKERDIIKRECAKYGIKNELEKGLVLEIYEISKLDNAGQGDIKFSTYMVKQYGQAAVTSALENYYRQKTGRIRKHGGYIRTAAQVAVWSLKKTETSSATPVAAVSCENCKKVDGKVINKFDEFEDDSDGIVVDYLKKKRGTIDTKSASIGDNEVNVDYVKSFLDYVCCSQIELTNSDGYKIAFKQQDGKWYHS